MSGNFLERFSTKVEIHKWLDELDDDADILILTMSSKRATFKSLGDLTTAQAIYMCRCFEHWSLEDKSEL